jgi:hypothetical protein
MLFTSSLMYANSLSPAINLQGVGQFINEMSFDDIDMELVAIV